jgi:hypothetical protein
VKQYLSLAYPTIQFNYIEIENYSQTGSSLGYSLLQCKEYIQTPFIYTCCDAIINESIQLSFDENTMFITNCEKDSYRYSTVSIEGDYINNIYNKGAKSFDSIYIGVTYIKDVSLFFDTLETIYKENPLHSELSDMNVYQRMMEQNIPFKYKLINSYFDIGSINTYNKANQFFKCKYDVLIKYNESISFMKDKVIKYFYNKDRNQSRIIRGKTLQHVIPTIINSTENYYSMELIDSKPLSKIKEPNIIYKLLLWAKQNLWTKIEDETNFSQIGFQIL